LISQSIRGRRSRKQLNSPLRRQHSDRLNERANVELYRTASVISIDLDLAVAFYETFFPSGQDADLIARMNKSDFYPAFNIISDSLHRNAIMAVCRIWDTRPDSANLNSLAKMLANNQVLADLARAGHPVDPKRLRKWYADVAQVNDSDELGALVAVRHRALAHTASPNKVYKDKARVAVYGDERRVIELTIPLVERANAFIGTCVPPFDEQRKIRREHAAKFWTQVGQS
jgi:hypothetical protein